VIGEKPMQWLGYIIWHTNEYFGISLGRLAPYVFGMIIGRRPHKVKRIK